MTYAQSRLRLGISTVGTLVVLSVLCLVFDVPQRVFGRVEDNLGAALGLQVLQMVIFLSAAIVLFLPFDIWGGQILPKRFGRHEMTLFDYLGGWLRGVVVQFVVMMISAVAILVAARLGGFPAVLGLIAVGLMLLLCGQVTLAMLVGDLTRSPANDAETARIASELRGWNLEMPRRLLVVDSRDVGFTGGIVGLPGRETVVLPGHWTHHLSLPVVAVALARRLGMVRTGARWRGVLLSVMFTFLGFVASSVAAGAVLGVPTELLLQTGPGVVTVSLFGTLWAFLGVLTLPSVSRPAVFAADAFAIDVGASSELLEQTIRSLDRMQDDEPTRTDGVETIYHPIPNVTNRLARLGGPCCADAAKSAAWNVNRLSLYLSWATLGLLSRAVHCNCGRPELWVLLPTD